LSFFSAVAAEISGKAWLFTLAKKGGETPGAAKVAEISSPAKFE